MPFTAKPGKFTGSIYALTIGTGERAIQIGGQNVLPLSSFDGPIPNPPRV